MKKAVEKTEPISCSSNIVVIFEIVGIVLNLLPLVVILSTVIKYKK